MKLQTELIGATFQNPVMRPMALLAVRRTRQATHLPLVDVGGMGSGVDAAACARAGASLAQVGTASFAEPRTAERIVRELGRWEWRNAAPSWDSLVAFIPGAEA